MNKIETTGHFSGRPVVALALLAALVVYAHRANIRARWQRRSAGAP